MASGEIWVFSEKLDLLAELTAGARSLAGDGAVAAVVAGTRAQAETARGLGADRVVWINLPEDALLEDSIPTLTRLVQEAQPRLVLIGATRRGRAAAGRLAARLDVTALTDVLEFLPAEGGLQARHMIFGGGAERVDRPLSEPAIATVGPGVFQPDGSAGSGGAEIVEIPFTAPEVRTRLRERKPRQVARVNLSSARKVVCVGRGLGKQEDLGMIEELARALGAEVACTRPLAEGFDWLPRERYIGISGAMIKPDLYLGVGVSGQAQHMIGMSESRVVVSVNKDSAAPLSAQADYVIAEDLYRFVPALIAALRG